MTAYKLLALDMDGTLLDSRKQVLPKTAAALERLAAAGVAVAFSTGRGLAELSDYVPNLPFIKYGSCISGGLVYDFSNQRTVFAHPFETKLALEVMAVSRQEAPMVHILTTTQSVAAAEALPHMADFHMGIYQGMFDRICTPVDDMPAFARANEGAVCKINLYHRSAESRERTRARLEEAGLAVQLAYAEETSLEVSPAGVSKAEGLSHLCDYLGITLAEAVAVGDAPNDTQALQVVGLPVAMGNATSDIKALAKMVVADNDHDGIAEVVAEVFGVTA